MSDTATVSSPATHRGKVKFWILMFGCCAAPIFWIGQLTLGYWISAQACYGSDHPTIIASADALRMALVAFDIVAIVAAAAGGFVAYASWRAANEKRKDGLRHALHISEGRVRFMALWGIMSSLCFICAIIFNTIGSVTVPLCTR